MIPSQRSQRVALYGGTFDPIHCGHLAVARAAVDTFRLTKVLFTPCARSPFKDKAPKARDDQRLEMLERATEGLAWAEVNRNELDNPPPSYTWKTLEQVRANLPDEAALFLLIGQDQWRMFHHWREYERILQMAELIVLGRPGEPLDSPPLEGIDPARIHLLPGDHPASASVLREAFAKGELSPELTEWLPEGVRTFLEQENPYEEA